MLAEPTVLYTAIPPSSIVIIIIISISILPITLMLPWRRLARYLRLDFKCLVFCDA
jgi:hypothetical protein